MPGKIHVPITVAVQGIDGALKTLGRLGGATKVAAAAFAGLQVAIAAIKFSDEAIEGAKNLERNMAGLKTVFQDATPQMEAFTKSASSLGLTMNEAAKASTFIGSVLKQSGYSISETADLTERLVGLGADLALTYGYDIQEALLGMTALFRGEYDPIEKFGVAMKQSEVNSRLAASSMDVSTDANRRFAEQQIRVQMLLERSVDAMGAVERQSGSLAVAQMRLRSEFENLRDTVAANLLPIITTFTSGLQYIVRDAAPKVKDAFDAWEAPLSRIMTSLLPAIETVIDVVATVFGKVGEFLDMATDPTSGLGEAISSVGIAFETLLDVIGRLDIDGSKVFEGIVWYVTTVANALHDIIYGIQTVIIWFRAAFEVIGKFLADPTAYTNGNTAWFDEIFSNIADEINRIADAGYKNRDAIEAQRTAQNLYNFELSESVRLSRKLFKDMPFTNSSSTLSWLQSMGFGGKAQKQNLDTIKTEATDYVAEFFATIEEEIAKQQARIKLGKYGLSEGLIDSILASKGWEGILAKIVAGGVNAAKKLQKEWERTAGGIKEAEKAREEASRKAEEAAKAAKDAANDLYDAFKEQKDLLDDLTKAINDFASELVDVALVSILETWAREVGQFEQQIISSFDAIQNKLTDGLIDKKILEQDYFELSAYAKREYAKLLDIAQQRDELANRFSLAEALIGDYRSAFNQAAKMVSIVDSLTEKTKEVTVTELSTGVRKLSGDLREFSVTLKREYTETVTETVNKTDGLVEGFRTIAEKARAFATNLRELKALGLDPMLFNQLVEAGVEAGGETAQALVDGGKDTIDEINNLFTEIDTLGYELGAEAAATLYSTGIDMADGLLNGIKSKQQELEDQARAMAAAFNSAFQASITVAAANAVGQAAVETIDVDAAKATLDALNSQLGTINTKISNAERYIKNINDDVKEAGATTKLVGYVSEQADLLAKIAEVSSTLASAQSFTPAPLPIGQTSSTTASTTNNYNITVAADTRTGGAKAGEAIVQSINNFQTANGPFSAYLK